ncbi:uncharacterized protein [Arachis hypogaea]|uniref:uncharacterized protein isoform X2 n=1 Tax=Arachis hypogaea TaxID=3818 RepID=UPI000DECE14F|nr:uncharacterized protein LOC112702689 isoform X2 [Arachis hypogaea]
MTNKLQGEPKDAQRSNKGERGVFRSIKVYPLEPNDKRLNYEPPTDLLSKLSLVSEVKKPAKLPSKLTSLPFFSAAAYSLFCLTAASSSPLCRLLSTVEVEAEAWRVCGKYGVNSTGLFLSFFSSDQFLPRFLSKV